MTEIPEHLLKRSRERRAAMGGGDGGQTEGGATSDTEAPSAAPAKAAAAPAAASMPAHPEPAGVPAAPPPSPMVEAYNRRRRIPFWAMPVLAALPLWAYIYQGTLDPPPAGEGPEVLGEELYAGSGCGGCHGAGGGGGVGPGFTGGAIYETFPSFVDHFRWVRLGSAGWQSEVGDTYGANQKPVGGGMPGFGEDQLTDAQLVFLILHERHLGGENPDSEDMTQLEEVALLMSENEAMTFDEALAEVGVEAGGEAAGGEGTSSGSEGESGPGTDAGTGTETSDGETPENQTGSGSGGDQPAPETPNS